MYIFAAEHGRTVKLFPPFDVDMQTDCLPRDKRFMYPCRNRKNRREIIYCKRAILRLSSSKILTPHPPLRLASVSSLPQQRRGVHTRQGERGMGVNILEDERDRIALLQ
jgi:hypothetical protein